MNYILFGEQYPMIAKMLNKLLTERLGAVDSFNTAKFDMNECDPSEAIEDASYLPLGYERKAVIFDNVKFLDKGASKDVGEQVRQLVSTSNDAVDIYLIVRQTNIDDNSPIVQAIKDNGQIFNFVLAKEDWPKFANKYFRDRDVNIEPNAVDELIVRVDGDLNRFINEANKLCLYKNHLTLIDITLMVARPIEDDAFQMSNALFRGDNATALSIFRDLQLLGSKATDALLPMLGSQFRFISEVCYLNDKGLSREEIASELACNPFRVKMALVNKRYLSRRDIAHILDDLYNLDYQIKSGQVDRFYGFELFLINFPN